jgi:regulator of nucleoside diphosphate kinase
MSWRGAFLAPHRRVITADDAQRLRNLIEMPVARHFSREVSLLADELQHATVVGARKIPPDVVTMNSRVVYSTHEGLRLEADLVYPWALAHSIGAVSVLSELGVATLGSRVGSRVTTRSRTGGRVEWAVVRLLYQPEEAGDLHL